MVGWQIMALKSGRDGLSEGAIRQCSRRRTSFSGPCLGGHSHAPFRYPPEDSLPRVTTTAVGLLCEQYMHMRRDDPAMLEGVTALIQHLPDPDGPDGDNLDHRYYATQVTA